jgi:hypothetical protein
MMRPLVRLSAVLTAALFALVGQAAAQQETRYTVLMSGKLAGAQTSITKPDGVREFTFEYNDRGRGPRLTSRIRLDANGLPVSLETTGNDYLKAPGAEIIDARGKTLLPGLWDMHVHMFPNEGLMHIAAGEFWL